MNGLAPKPRTLPHSIEAEQETLGAILTDNEYAWEFRAFLSADDFFHPAHGAVYSAALSEMDRGGRADPVTLRQRLADNPALREVGGADYLTALAQSLSSRVTAPDYARHVHSLATRRRLIAWGEQIAAEASSGEGEAAEMIAEAGRGLADLSADSAPDSIVTLGQAAESVLTAAEARAKGAAAPVVPTCLPSLDSIIGGLPLGGMTILAARPSMGKTALAGHIALEAAKRYHGTKGRSGAQVAFFSLEMSADGLTERFLSAETGIPYFDIGRQALTPDQIGALETARGRIAPFPLSIVDRSGMSVEQIAASLRRMRRDHDIRLCIVDYLQIMRPPDRYRGSKVNEVGEMSRGLRDIARDLNIAMLVLCQLNRQVEARAYEGRSPNPRPHMADLKDSGAIEQDADLILMLWRPEVYLQKQAEAETDPERVREAEARLAQARNVAFVDVVKQRQGRLDKAKLHLLKETGRFVDRPAERE